MPTTYTLATPASVGSMTNPVTVSSLQITGITFSSTPALAQVGTGVLSITLTDPISGWQETVTYNDASVLTLWNTPVTSSESGAVFGDVIASTVFAKLLADGKLPAGNVSIVAIPTPTTISDPTSDPASVAPVVATPAAAPAV